MLVCPAVLAQPFDRALFDAELALDDGLTPLAERLGAEAVRRMPREDPLRAHALDLLFESILAQGDAERLLRSVSEHSDPNAAADERNRLLLWRARGLAAAGRPGEAVELLRAGRQAQSGPADPSLELEWPRSLRAAGELEASLDAYKALDAELLTPARRGLAVLEQARLLEQLNRRTDAEALVRGLLAPEVSAELPAALRDAAQLHLALSALAAGRNGEARDLLLELSEAEHTDPEQRAAAWVGRAAIEEALADSDAAQDAMNRALSLVGAAGTRYAVRHAQAYLLLRLGRTDAATEAIRDLNRLGSRRPETAAAVLALAEACFSQGDYERAHREAQTVIEGATDVLLETRAQRIRGEALWELGRPAEAAVALARAAEAAPSPEDREALLPRVAKAQRDAGLHARAVETLRRFRQLFPQSDRAAQVALLEGDSLAQYAPEQAEAHFAALAEAHADSVEGAMAWFRAAELAAERDALAVAIDRYRLAEEHSSSDAALKAAAAVGLGLLRSRTFEFEQALEHFEHAVAAGGPAGEQAEFLRAAALYNVGDARAALEACESFLDRRPDSIWAPDVTFWLGTYHFNRRQHDIAAGAFERFAATWPTRPERDAALLWLAHAQFHLRQFEEAIGTASKLIREHPASALLAEARMVHGESLCERMRFDEAILVFDELLALHPRSPWVARALGRKGDSLFVLGSDDAARYQESIEAYRTLLALPDQPLDIRLQAAYKIGRCHERAGQADAALDQYYRGVVLRYAEARESGLWPNERARAWFARGALSAAELLEQREDWPAAAAVLERLAREDTPSRSEAAERARRLQQANPLRR